MLPCIVNERLSWKQVLFTHSPAGVESNPMPTSGPVTLTCISSIAMPLLQPGAVALASSIIFTMIPFAAVGITKSTAYLVKWYPILNTANSMSPVVVDAITFPVSSSICNVRLENLVQPVAEVGLSTLITAAENWYATPGQLPLIAYLKMVCGCWRAISCISII